MSHGVGSSGVAAGAATLPSAPRPSDRAAAWSIDGRAAPPLPASRLPEKEVAM